MNRRFITSVAFLPALLYASHAFASEDDTYDIVVNPKNGEIAVSAHLYRVQPDEILCEPAFGMRYGEHLIDIRFMSKNGAPISPKNATISKHKQKNTVLAGCYAGIHGDIDIQYTIAMDALKEENAWMASNLSPIRNDRLFAIPGVSIFVERNAHQSHDSRQKTQVTVDISESILSTLPMQDPLPKNELFIQNNPGQALHAQNLNQARKYRFYANNTFELTRSYWAFGQFKLMSAVSDKTSIQIAYFPDAYPNAAIIQREITQMLSSYAELMPQRTPGHLAVFLFSAPFDTRYHHGFARPGGIILQMGKKAASQNDTRRILIAHELFHQYNGENLQYDPGKYEETAWMREGMTQYIALRTLQKIGLISASQLYDWMASSIQKQTSEYDPYHHGFFLSQAIEQQWTLYHTGCSIEKFWQWLQNAPEKWSVQYSNREIEQMLTAYSAFDFAQFFKKYVPRKSKMPIDDLLKLAGLCKYSYQEVTHSIGIDYELDVQKAALRIKTIDPTGAAAQAGLKKNDIIVPEPDIDWTDQADKKYIVLRGGKRLQFKVPTMIQIRTKLAIRPCQ